MTPSQTKSLKASLCRAVLVAAITFPVATLPACGAVKWAITGTDSQPAPYQQAADAAKTFIPAPIGGIAQAAILLGGLLATALTGTTKKDSSTTPPSA